MKQKRVDERQKKAIRKKLKRKNVVSAVAGGDTVVVEQTINNVTNTTTGVDNLYELNDVALGDYPADGDVLTYDAVTDKWVNEQPAAGGGIATATASGTNTYTATISGVSSYTTHDAYEIIFTNGNTGASTININSLGAKSLKKSVSTALSSGDIAAGQSFIIVYDGTNFQVIGISGTIDHGGLSGLSDDDHPQYNFWRALPTMTRVSGTQFTIPDTGNAGNWDKILSRLTVIRWTDTTTHLAMVSSSSYSSDVVTVNLVGDTLDSSFTTTSGKYAIEKARDITFAVAGTIVATTNIARIEVSNGSLKIFGARAIHGVAGTTNATTYDINYGSTPSTTSSIFTTKISVSSGSTDSGFYTANDNTTTQDGYYFNLDCDSVSTTAPIDGYVKLFFTFLNYQYLT